MTPDPTTLRGGAVDNDPATRTEPDEDAAYAVPCPVCADHPASMKAAPIGAHGWPCAEGDPVTWRDTPHPERITACTTARSGPPRNRRAPLPAAPQALS